MPDAKIGNDRIKILHDIGSFVYGGTARLMLDIFSCLPRDIFNIMICCHRNQYLQDVVQAFQEAGVKTVIFPQTPGPRLVYALTRFIRQERFHIVHTHHYYGNLYGRLAAILAGSPVVITYQHNWPGEERSYHRVVFRLLNRWTYKNIVVSEVVRRYDIERVRLSPDKVITIHNGIDTKNFRVTPAEQRLRIRRKLGLPAPATVVGMAGRLVDWKRFDLFIKAASIVLGRKRMGHFLVVGDGEMRDSLIQLVQQLNLNHHVHFLGWQSDMPAIYQAMDVFCLTSDSGGRSFSPAGGEGFGLVSIEAMASRVPVVAVDTEVNREVISPECGLLCQSRPEEIAKKVIQLIDDTELRNKLGQAGQRRVEEQFDIQRTAQQLSDMYKKAVEQRNHAGRRIMKLEY